MRLFYTLVFISCFVLSGTSQSIHLTFHALDNDNVVHIDSVRITNLDQSSDTIIYWPDTVLSLYFVGVHEYEQIPVDKFYLQLVSSNPVDDKTMIEMFVPANGGVYLSVFDVSGKLLNAKNLVLKKGRYLFSYSPGQQGLTVVSGIWNSVISSVKVASVGFSNGNNELNYIGEIKNQQGKMSSSVSSFIYNIGDSLKFSGWLDGVNSVLYDAPYVNSDYTFYYGLNLSCPGIPGITYGGRYYHTTQIGTQCWLRENLNIGIMVHGYTHQENNGIIEKHCYNDDSSNCEIYGGLYQWQEMIQYSPDLYSWKGICPNGWHIPHESEWQSLIIYLGDSTIAGGKLKEEGTMHWNAPNTGATNETGFTALGAGYYDGFDEGFIYLNSQSFFWSNLGVGWGVARIHWLANFNSSLSWYNHQMDKSSSVRCIKDTCTSVPMAYAGPDQTLLTSDSAIMAGNTPPAWQEGIWKNSSPDIGYFSDSHDPNSTFHGIGGVQYKLVWTVKNECTLENRDTVSITFIISGAPCPGIPFLSYNGKTYHTIQIGSQCWLKENLNVGIMIPGDSVSKNNGIIEKYCYNNDTANCNIYGGLYQWDEMMNYNSWPYLQGICPSGFHVPQISEWYQLTDYLGGDAGGKLKETGTSHWLSPNFGATNLSGFTALGAGYKGWSPNFYHLNHYAEFWSSTEVNQYDAKFVSLSNSYDIADFDEWWKLFCSSVRCLKDTCSQPPSQSNAGPDQINLQVYSTNLSGNTPPAGQFGLWKITEGIGGNIDSINNPSSSFTGQPGQLYKLVWTIRNNCYSCSSDEVIISFDVAFGQPCPGIPTIAYEGQTYNTIMIGLQCWLKENLNIGSMIQGDSVQKNNGIIEKYCYNNDTSNCTIYGGLYQWDEMVQYLNEPWKGICPDGWHIPVETEWQYLITFLSDSSVAGGKLKENGIIHWSFPNTGATNESYFTGLGAGYRNETGSFQSINNKTGFWSTSAISTDIALYHSLSFNGSNTSLETIGKDYGFSVRCMKDTCSSVSIANAGPDQYISSGDSAILNGNSPPSWQTGKWEILNGIGGYFTNVHNPLAVFFGQPGQAYKLLWIIKNYCLAANQDTVVISFVNITGQPCPGIPSLNYGGQIYHTVQVGLQCWMKENLNIGIMINGTPSQTDNGIIEKYCYNNDTANCTIYGGLYQWDEMMNYTTNQGGQGICPAGWHVPADNEWCTLSVYLDPTVNCNGLSWTGTDAGGKLKETGNSHWNSPNTGATNSSGFTALGAGRRSATLGFMGFKSVTYFWTSYEDSPISAFIWLFGFAVSDISHHGDYQSYGYSVRCIKN